MQDSSGEFTWTIYFRGGVGDYGIGTGVYQWESEVQRAGQPWGRILVAGDDSDLANRATKSLVERE